jgi:hypothetical protein
VNHLVPRDYRPLPPPPAPAPPEVPKLYIGLDLGCVADFSALVVVERHRIPDPHREGRTTWRFDVRHIHRWPLKTPYPQVVGDVRGLFAEAPVAGSTLAIDETGVGKPVTQMFQTGGINGIIRPFVITCGSAVTYDHVAKKHLVGAVQAPLSSGRLRFAEGLQLGPVLRAELENFETTIDERTRNESFAAGRNGPNDDTVLALALALHCANQGEWAMARG